MTEAEIAAKNIEGRACIACKHFKTAIGLTLCEKQETTHFDVLWGIRRRSCRDCRESSDLCGPEGKFFEPKGRE